MRLDARVPEPELMEDPEQARAYSEADFSVPHQAVVDDLLARHPEVRARSQRVLDVGCGPADVTTRLATALPHAEIVGIDAGPRMLALGAQRVAAHGLDDRVRLLELRLPATDDDLARLGRFGVIVSNAMLHHLADPSALWTAARALAAPGAVVHVVDLRRPEDDDTVDALVAEHARGEPTVLVDDFRASLRAAYRPHEVRAQLRACGLAGSVAVDAVGDRHLVVSGVIDDPVRTET
jgi:2-polyprenyl-3-methyl-5-hydroxy-6-metoxy-1,4-benzoquinol methylase